MQITVLAGGRRYSWADIKVPLFGLTTDGITEISYDDNTELVDNYGRGNMPTDRTIGKYEAKASITLRDYVVRAILDAAGKGKRLQDVAMFDIPVVYDDGNGNLRTDILRNAQFTGTGVETKTGDGGGIALKCVLKVSHIDWNF